MPSEIKFTDEQKRAYRAAFAPSATDEQWLLFITECERRALVPGVHVVFQLRTANEYDPRLQQRVTVQKVTMITTINALRLIAERSGKFEGYGRFTYYYGDADGSPSVKSDIPLGKIPHAVSVELYRQGWRKEVFAVARFDAYCQTKKDGNREVPTAMWALRGEEQLAKCAEALGLRMVAPEECGGLYIAEEFEKENKTETNENPQQAAAPVAIPQPTVAPAVNQAPADVPTIQTSPIREVAEASAKAVETAKHKPQPPAAQPAPPKPAPPAAPVAKATPPAPPAPPKPAAPPVPVASAPKPAPPAPALHSRVPHVDGPVQESPEEIAACADAIARDKDPEETPSTAAVAAAIKTVAAATPEQISQAVAPVSATAPVPDGEQPAAPEQYQAFIARSAKIVRDKLEGTAKMKGAGAAVKAYILKKSGKADLRKLSATQWETIISELEKAEPEAAAKLVKEAQ